MLELRPVTTPADLEILRCLRNECRHSMTAHQELITTDLQARWWAGLDHARVQPYLAFSSMGCVGFGLVRQNPDGRRWLTGGIAEDQRRHGYGRSLFELLILLAGKPCYLDVLMANHGARHLYEALGFLVIGHRLGNHGMIVTMELADP